MASGTWDMPQIVVQLIKTNITITEMIFFFLNQNYEVLTVIFLMSHTTAHK